MNKTLKSIWGAFAIASVIIASYVSNAPLLIALGSLSGIIFVVGVAFQWKWANLFGAICSSFFGYVSYQNGLFGNALIQFGFVVPMSLYGLWLWFKRKDTCQGLKRSLTNSEAVWFLSLSLVGLACSMAFSFYTGAAMPVADAITTVLPVLGTILLVNAYREQWYVWWAYNGMEVAMWFVIASAAPEMLALLVMRLVFLFNSFIGWYEWKR